ncbi:hypothetical protein A2U01_0009903 [Trifolium medium]|uniref:Uncharacterized protein n=1 Tax=Trifolium medium TaxID=97028 RepID=A0A392MNC5_9FABA|nr:hypothetical protein [Trifolium medium]
MSMKSEGKRLDAICKSNEDCRPGCQPDQRPKCLSGRCWCFKYPPAAADKISSLISSSANSHGLP